MSNKAGLRRILGDLSDNMAGLGWAARMPGQAVSGYEGPVLVAEDIGDILRHLEVRLEGEGPASGVLASPVLTCKGPAGNLQYLRCDPDGSLIITNENPGDQKSESGTNTPTQPQVATPTEIDVVSLTLVTDKTYRFPEMLVSSTHEVLWRLLWDNDGTPTELARVLTDVGDTASEPRLKLKSFTTPGSGTQTLKVVGAQQRGAASDMHAVVAALEATG